MVNILRLLLLLAFYFIDKLCIGKGMICRDSCHKYHEWYFKIITHNFTSRVRFRLIHSVRTWKLTDDVNQRNQKSQETTSWRNKGKNVTGSYTKVNPKFGTIFQMSRVVVMPNITFKSFCYLLILKPEKFSHITPSAYFCRVVSLRRRANWF